MSFSSKSGARRFQRLIFWYNILKWESKFTLGLNTAEIINIIKNSSNKSCSELKFLQKTRWTHMSISLRSAKVAMFKYYNVPE